MTEPPPDRDTNDGNGLGAEPESPPGAPGWVKAFGIALLALLLLVVGLVVFGGGQHGPWRHAPGGGPGAAETPQPPGAPSNDAGPRPQSGAGAPADAGEATRTVDVAAIDELTFEPSAIEVSAGEVVTFVVTNAGQLIHEFTIGDAAMQRERATMMGHMPPGVSHDLSNSVTLQPGETRRLTWRFGEAGALEYGCHVQGHYEALMRGRIAVD